MKEKALLTALVCTIIFTGCKQNQQACAAYAKQCNELHMGSHYYVIQPKYTSNQQWFNAKTTHLLHPTPRVRPPADVRTIAVPKSICNNEP